MKTNTLTLKNSLEKLATNEITLEQIYQDLESATNEGKDYNIFLTLNPEAQNQSKAAASKDLKGIPLAIKDNICTKGVRTTASSAVLENYTPPFSATLINKLEAAGAVTYGKTNLDAWAHGSSTETSAFGPTLNPRNTDHLPGGSSGGSAAAVAADMCIAAIGTETAGSIRQPSAWCGVVGLKPTYGRVSRYGIAAMCSSTDSPGPITKTVEDAAILLNHMAGHDPKNDGTTSPQPVPDFTQALGKSIKGMKIGVIYTDIDLDPQVKSTFLEQTKVLEDLGAEVELVDALDPKHSVAVYTVVQRGEVSSNLGRYDGIRYGKDRSYFGDEAKRRVMLGTFTLSKGYADKYYNLAQQVRTLYIQDFDKLFKQYDALISLSSPGFAKKLGATEGKSMFGELEDMLLEPSSISGLPGINVPCYKDPETNLFLGMSIVAPMWQEETIIRIADAYEKATNWNTWRNK